MSKKVTFALAILSLIVSTVFAVSCKNNVKECAHEGGTATCIKKAVCTKCGEEYGELAAHTYGEWKHNAEKHWKECTTEGCTAKAEEGNHEGGTATCVKKAVCTKCSEESGELAAHTYGEWKHNAEKHWKECTTEGCTAKGEEGNHEGGKATCTQKAVCSDCGEEYGELAEHSYKTWKHDDEQHWKECACGATTAKTAHDYNAWDKSGSSYDYKVCECGVKNESTAFDKTVSLINQKILLTGTVYAIKLSGISDYASVESITLGEYDLKNDINALDISAKLKADAANHGKQTLTVTVKDEQGESHEILVPVTLITKEIASVDDFKSIQPSSANKGVYGYYVLKNDISDNSLAGSAYADDWEETTGFFGTLDGQGHVISTAANGAKGIFGILRNATIKNVTVKDNWRSAHKNYALLAKACFNSTLENVTFTFAAGNTQAQVGNGYGWISYAEFSGNTLKNVTVNDTKGYGSLFGYKFVKNVFDNVKINGTYTEMGHTADVKDESGAIIEAGKSVTYDDVTKAEAVEKVTLEGRQDFVLDGKNSEIDLGEYADCEILSIITSTGYELYSLSSSVADEVFKAAKQAHGEQNFIITVSRDGVIIEVTVPVTVITKVITTMSDLQSAVKCVGADIYGYYVLGKDVSYTEDGFNAVQASGGWSGDKAFRGTLDGRTYTITTDSSAAAYGLFGTLNGATIKSVTIKDANNSVAYRPILARNAYNATFDGVTIEILGGTKLAGTAENTPFVGNTMQKCVWKNCKITSSVEIVNVFAKQSGNDFSGGLTIISNVTGGFSAATAEYPAGVTVKTPATGATQE